MKRMKLFLAVCVMMMTIGVNAQEKYDYASVVYRMTANKKGFIAVATEDKFEENKVEIEEGTIAQNLKPVLAVINKMNGEGWEVYNNQVTDGSILGPSIYYFLRKKKN